MEQTVYEVPPAFNRKGVAKESQKRKENKRKIRKHEMLKGTYNMENRKRIFREVKAVREME